MVMQGSIQVYFYLIEEDSANISVTDLVVFMKEQVDDGNFRFEFEGTKLVAFRDSVTLNRQYQDDEITSANDNKSATIAVVVCALVVLTLILIFLAVLVYKKYQCSLNEKLQHQSSEKSTLKMPL
ncbi:uncharacterized protein LOC117113091 [Anneissia japonica]|uniref:uncharacterized protein LOC117113091 n=1 Tax=Anneissia japonica TaxID=1529436 RepID=UPI0014259D54|nr:uncharacterized protein LOC117113091 [Anneissia japonica]